MFSLKVTGVESSASAARAARIALLGMLAAGVFACSAADPAPAPATTNPPVTGPTEPGAVGPGAPAPVGVAPSAGDPAGPAVVNPGDPATPSAPGVSAPTASSPTPSGTPAPGPAGTFVPEDDEPLIVTGPGEEMPAETCNSQEVSFEKVIPSVMLVLDRSTSMFASNLQYGSSPTPFGNYDDRWEALRTAVAGLEPYSAEVQFGAVTYTGYATGECPEVQGLDLDVATGSFDQIVALLPDSATAIPDNPSETPTAEGIEAALEKLLAVEADGPKYLVLVTDGLPDYCHGELINKGDWCNHDPAFGVVQNAFANGVTTYVVGLIGGTNASEIAAGDYFLNGIAHAGQGLELQPPTDNLHCISQESTYARDMMPDNTFYADEEGWRAWAAATYAEAGYTYAEQLYFSPEDGDALGVELGSVVASTRSCAFEMDEAVIRTQAAKGTVQLQMADGTQVALTYQDANGWDLDPVNDYTVAIQGTYCEAIQTDLVANVKIEFPCEVRVPRVR